MWSLVSSSLDAFAAKFHLAAGELSRDFIGRAWIDDAGQHILVMVPGDHAFELYLRCFSGALVAAPAREWCTGSLTLLARLILALSSSTILSSSLRKSGSGCPRACPAVSWLGCQLTAWLDRDGSAGRYARPGCPAGLGYWLPNSGWV